LPPSLDMFALATPVQGAALLATAAATAYALVTRDRRRRALAMLAAPVLAVIAIGTLAETVDVPSIGTKVIAAGVAGAIGVVVLTWIVWRRPNAFALLAVAALPFRVPVSIGDSAANLLLPLYGVIAAGILTYAWKWLRAEQTEDSEREPLVRWLQIAFAGVLGLYALQALYSDDLEQALKNLCLFYVPFAVLFLLLLDTIWTRKLLTASFRVTVALALVFAAIGCVEFATGHLLITNEKVVEANDLLPYFRVNSLFFDPNIFGRYLALTMLLLATVLLWTRRSREAGLIGAALVLLWLGLVFSLSQSSFAALLLGLAVLAALRWKPWPVVAAIAGAAVVAVAVVALAPGLLNLETGKQDWWNRASSGRADLIAGGLRMVRDKPLIGFGSGAYADTFRAREHVSSEKVAAASHTIPLTVTAEQGVIGLAAYLALVAVSLALVFRGLRARLQPGWPGVATIALAGIAAAYAALLLHTLVYAAYLEDPLVWVLLAIAAGLRTREGTVPPDEARASTPATKGGLSPLGVTRA
jgi:putative inorganic carbon (HCO3(-)) transporter